MVSTWRLLAPLGATTDMGHVVRCARADRQAQLDIAVHLAVDDDGVAARTGISEIKESM